ncbi:DinB superfamily protein [Paenibacillus sp. UNCCL117]|uniref:DinB family protein n=1 Tax=unclassified Paenibacillus TaxID=185978 RepID=UPI00088647D5|nr:MULTISPECIES: DinB family protein [unclassified Paenibacillus]SDC44944.1 DinB superfamily protein [Paenibacillus sp. cl123]SFW12628.1 DinB superfamily protein [Paenibacillus sp. UNCCL117]
MHKRPEQGEYSEYYEIYVKLVPAGDLLDILKQQEQQTLDIYAQLSDEQAEYRYAPGKWSLKEILGHLADNERIMSYRLLRISRGDTSTLAGYDQDPFVQAADFDRVPLALLLDDYRAARASTLTLLRTLDGEKLARKGIANGSVLSVRALACIIAGHETHHLNVIRERYRQA